MVCLNPHIKVTSVAAPVPENVQLRAVQLAIDHFTQEAKLNLFFFSETRNKICVTNRSNGSFLSSEIGEIGW